MKMTELWRCEDALMGNCQRETCGGFNWHKFVKGQCDNNKRTCGNTESRWNQMTPVRCVKRVKEEDET